MSRTGFRLCVSYNRLKFTVVLKFVPLQIIRDSRSPSELSFIHTLTSETSRLKITVAHHKGDPKTSSVISVKVIRIHCDFRNPIYNLFIK